MITSIPSLRRLLAFTTAFTMALPVFPSVSLAQDASDASAPPSRVGQIASLNGSVSFNGSGSGGWAAAALNYPVSSGDSIYTQDNSQAAIALDSSQITLASDTELQVTALDQNNFAATQSQGEAAYSINSLQQGQSFAITTPRGEITINQNGEYDVIAGDANTPTVVNVFQGAATVTDPGATLQVAAGQSGVLTGTNQTVAQLGQAQQDSFTNTVFAQAAPPPAPSYAPPVVSQMTGASELTQYGSWDQSQQYGAVWYPNVAPGWAPYRQGYWANVQPWGWTWVESEPWGFAPFHYGRWVDYNDRWGWAPAPAYTAYGGYGPAYQPVYAPAVVSFFGLGLAAGITIAALSSGSVGWIPLAPNEPFYPYYRCPPAYIRQINYVNVRNINIVNIHNNYYNGKNFTPNRFANQRGATYVPAGVMSRGEHVAGYAHTPDPNMLAKARPIDTGSGSHTAGQAAGYRLPEANAPLAHMRPGTAPTPSSFSQRRTLPPATISHEPAPSHPGTMMSPHEMTAPHQMNAPMQPNNHPSFSTMPGYHPPPPPPPAGAHLGKLPPAENFRPTEQNHLEPGISHPSQPQEFHPQPGPQGVHPEAHPMAPERTPSYHPPTEAYHPQTPAYHPPAPAYHPPVEAYHPPAPAYHQPAQAYHPPAQAFHPSAPSQRPQSEPPHHDQQKKPG